MDKELFLFNCIVVRLKKLVIAIGAICAVVALHLNLLHGPEWFKDTVSLIALIYLALSRPAAYKE